MSDGALNDLLQYYKRELAYLRTQGAEFALRYPKIAPSLGLNDQESLDPHTERLIESTAFLAARVHRDLDQEFPHVASALLANVCPSLVQPVPSMSVVRCDLDASQGKVTAGYHMPRHTGLYAQTASHEMCRFRTAWDVTLWPIHVAAVRFDSDTTLRLTLEATADNDFSELEVDRLRFHLHGDWAETVPIYELLVSGVDQVLVQNDGTALRSGLHPALHPALHSLPATAWREVGYARDETVLAPPEHAYLPYVLLQEYFAFPRKFHFFDLVLPPGVLGNGNRCDIVLRLNRSLHHPAALRASTFQLGCVPVINVFPRTSEPVALNQGHYEYHLVGDRRRESATEIHTITSVVALDPASERSTNIPGFAAGPDRNPGAGAQDSSVFWFARREHSQRQNIPGSETFISFIDRSSGPQLPHASIVYANLLCTNRRLAEQLDRGAKMGVEGVSQNVHLTCLYVPTAQHTPPLGSAALWHLVSLLTLNYQSLRGGDAAWLRELISSFTTDSERDHEQIRGIFSMASRTVTAHVGQVGWRGYCRGTEISLHFEEEAFAGASPLLLGAVLARFFSMYTSINSFVRLVVRRREQVWKQWDSINGRQEPL